MQEVGPLMRLVFAILSIFKSDTRSLQRDLDAQMRAAFPAHEPGAALLVVRNGKTIFEKGYGLAYVRSKQGIGPQTTFRMASVSKQFTAMAVLLLEKEGKLKQTDVVRQYFPELPAWADEMTLAHLLTHTSGIWDAELLLDASQGKVLTSENTALQSTLGEDYQPLPQVTDADYLPLLAKETRTYFPAGTRFRYSNTGFCLLAVLVEKVSGQTFASFLQERIFTPLGMKDTRMYEGNQKIPHRAFGYRKERDGFVFADQSSTSATQGDGAVYTSLRDYAKWHQALQENRLVNLSEALALLNFPLNEALTSFYGAGWFFNSEGVYFHSGTTSGFSNLVFRIPQTNTVVAFFSNRAGEHATFSAIQKRLSDEVILPLPQDTWDWHNQTQ